MVYSLSAHGECDQKGELMSDIFLSYASEDRERVIPLVEKLESEGFSVWWDRRIGVGATFDIEIERELDAAACVIVVWSEHSIRKEWVRDEATEGQERGILVPVLFDAIRPPLGTRRLQTADLVGWPKVRHEGALAQLLASVRNYVAEPTLDTVTDPEKTESDRIVIAVLPFDDRSPGGDMKYLCDGLAEDLMDALFHVEGLHVLSATDTFKHNQETRNIGNALGATVVLEGGVQSAGKRLAITSRLIQVQSGLTLWSHRYLKEAEDAFEIQSDISNSVVEGLRTGLGLSTAE
jgi:serine/threonine-protein kinase